MRRCIARATFLILLGWAVPSIQAHYNMLLPDKSSVKKGETVTFTYQWGHPFEHQLFDAPAPERLFVLTPEGKKIDLLKTLEKITVPAGEGKKVTAYRLRFTPEERGDYVFALKAPPVWMAEDEEFLDDTVKVVLHVQAQRGWDIQAGEAIEVLPLTRPYGLHAGMAFQAQIYQRPPRPPGIKPPPEPLTREPTCLVEVERYNATAPKELPPDEHVTRTAKTDPNGVVTCTLTEPGWWCVTPRRNWGNKERDGKMYPVRQRSTFWIHVDDKTASKAEK